MPTIYDDGDSISAFEDAPDGVDGRVWYDHFNDVYIEFRPNGDRGTDANLSWSSFGSAHDYHLRAWGGDGGDGVIAHEGVGADGGHGVLEVTGPQTVAEQGNRSWFTVFGHAIGGHGGTPSGTGGNASATIHAADAIIRGHLQYGMEANGVVATAALYANHFELRRDGRLTVALEATGTADQSAVVSHTHVEASSGDNTVNIRLRLGDLAGGSSELLIANNTFRMGGGSDWVTIGSSSSIAPALQGNVFDGGAGCDVLTFDFSANLDIVLASIGIANFEHVRTGIGADTLTGDEYGNGLHGGWNEDVLFGGRGDDLLDGGAGDDRLVGGDGEDTAWFLSDADAAGIDASLRLGTATGAGFDLLEEIENLRGSAYGDRLEGDSAANRLEGEGGDDILRGLAGDDILVGDWAGVGCSALRPFIEPGDDMLIGGNGWDTADYSGHQRVTIDLRIDVWQDTTSAGHDTLIGVENVIGTDFADQLVGNVFSNMLVGGRGNDYLFGEGASDVLIGGAGRDTLDGGEKADELLGGAGDDIYVVDTVNDKIVEYATGGHDLVRSWAADFTLARHVEDLALQGSKAANGTGNDLANSLRGNSASNTLNGLSGDDLLEGAGGADVLKGGRGRDTLIGGGSGDQLVGGVNKDTLTGGAGADTFFFGDGEVGASASSADVVTDFSHAAGDRIHLRRIDADTAADGDQNFTFIGDAAFTGVAAQLHYVRAGNNTFIEGDTNGDGTADFVIRLNGLHDLVAGDFVL